MRLARLVYKIKKYAWKVAPACFFNPKEGDLNLLGDPLIRKPSLSLEDRLRFSALRDPRFYDKRFYKKFEPFIPEEFELVGPPNGQNCFMYAYGIDGTWCSKTKAIHREVEKEFVPDEFNSSVVQVGDIISYWLPSWVDDVLTHAAVYTGNMRVRSRWGVNAPLLEHPIFAVSSTYWNNVNGYLCIERRLK